MLTCLGSVFPHPPAFEFHKYVTVFGRDNYGDSPLIIMKDTSRSAFHDPLWMKQSTFDNQVVYVTWNGFSEKSGTGMAVGLGLAIDIKTAGKVRIKLSEQEQKRLKIKTNEIRVEPHLLC